MKGWNTCKFAENIIYQILSIAKGKQALIWHIKHFIVYEARRME
jgi:hypothetical protein